MSGHLGDAQVTALAFDEDADLLLLTDADGYLYEWSPQAGAVTATLQLGGSPSAITVLPGSGGVLVSNLAATREGDDTYYGAIWENTIFKIDLADAAVSQIHFTTYGYEHGVFDIGSTLDGRTLVTTKIEGSGASEPLRTLEFGPDGSPSFSTLTVPGNYYGQIQQDAYQTTSEDGRYIVVTPNNNSDGPIYLYDEQAGSIVASSAAFRYGAFAGNNGHVDVNSRLGLIVDQLFGYTLVVDTHLKLAKDLSALFHPGDILGAHFTQDGLDLLLLDVAASEIRVFDTHSWAEVRAIALPTPLAAGDIDYTGENMVLGEDGRLLFVKTHDGFQTIDLAANGLDLAPTSVFVGTAGADSLIGSAHGDQLTGAAGADTLDGRAGPDTLIGGAGDDVYYAADPGDRIIEAVGGGYDTVYVSNSAYVLDAGQEVERMVATGPNGVALHGNEFDNDLVGNAQANVIDGGAGADTMEGGAGADTYTLDDRGDVVVEAPGGGVDTAKVDFSYTLPANVENLTFYFTAPDSYLVGLAGTGNASANQITGLAAADTLDGAEGVDTLIGGKGDDLYYVDNVGDRVIEAVGAGADTVDVTASQYSAPANVETVVYVGTSAFLGYGGPGAQADYLYAGSATAATLHGGAGSDHLFGGAGGDSLYGEAGADVIQGNAGNDYIRSLTGEGPDTIDGGAGTDLLTIERGNVTQALHFTVGLSGAQALGEGTMISGIEQIRIVGGSGNDAFLGGALDDVLKGGGGDDTLVGGNGADVLEGGSGHDRLTGGDGADTFRFDNALAGADDTVVDFVTGVDHVALSKSGFGVAALGDFDIVSATGGPFEAKATLVVDTVNHALAWDADGTGAGAARVFAHGAFTTTAADYVLF